MSSSDFYVGFWQEYTKNLCHKLLINENFKNPNDNYTDIIKYLRSCPQVFGSRELADCILSKPKEVTINPFGFYSDGKFIWSVSIIHYIENFGLRLPDVFVEHIKSQNYIFDKQTPIDVSELGAKTRTHLYVQC